MANPQKENGYTPIANEIMDKLAKTRIPGEARQVLDFILRKTYGFHKKEDYISNAQFVSATGLKKTNVCRSLNKLVDMNIVIKKDNSKRIIYCFNKDFDSWKLLSKKITVIKKDNAVIKKDNAVIKKDNNCYQKRYPQKIKDNIQKKLLQKRVENKFSIDSIEMKLALLLFNLIRERNPDHKKPNLQKWAEHIDLMIRRDKRDPEKIAYIIRWCQSDNVPDKRGFCWANNILSTKKLRDQYDQLVLKMMEKEGGKNRSRFTPGAIDYLRKKGVFDKNEK